MNTAPGEFPTPLLEAQSSTYTFEGDNMVDIASYQYTMNSWYLKKLLQFETALPGVGIELLPEDHERAKRLFVTAHWLDYKLDDTANIAASFKEYAAILHTVEDDTSISNEIKSSSSPGLLSAVTLLNNAVRHRSKEYVQNLAKTGIGIGAIAVAKAQESSSKRYINMVEEEGRLTGQLVSLGILGEAALTTSDTTNDKLIKCIEDLTTFMTLVDAAYDLPADNKAGLTQVKPSRWNQALLYGRAIKIAAKGTNTFTTKLLLDIYNQPKPLEARVS